MVAWSPGYEPRLLGLEKLHPFDIGKFGKIARALKARGVPEELFVQPEEVDRADLEAVHPKDFLDHLSHPRVLSMALEIPIPPFLPPALLDQHALSPLRRMVQGTLLCARFAAEKRGLGVNLGGGFHHARPELAHGFCLYNDVATAIAALRRDGFDSKILIVDTDAHQGDGNHAFFTKDPGVFCFSVHEEGLFPHPKIPGDLDVELPAGSGDAALVATLEEHLPRLLQEVKPAVVFHVAGVDVLATDPLTHMQVTPAGVVQRDMLVARQSLASGAGVVHLLAGGYGPEAWKAQADSAAALLLEDWPA